LEAAVARMLARFEEDRYSSFDDILKELRLILHSPQWVTSAHRLQHEQAFTGKNHGTAGDINRESHDQESQTYADGNTTRSYLLAFSITAILLVSGMAGAFYFLKDSQTKVFGMTFTPAAQKLALFSKKMPDGSKQFDFPAESEGLGQIAINDRLICPAAGHIEAPPGAFIRFEAGPLLSNRPQLFECFAADDIQQLSFAHFSSWKTEQFRHITGLKSISTLTLTMTRVSSADIAYINQLPALNKLSVSQTSITAADLLKLTRLKQLRRLEANDVTGLEPVLEALKDTSTIGELSMKNCELHDNDVANIAAMPSMNDLTLDDNPISIDGIRYLTKLKYLFTLQIRKLALGPEVLDVLRECKFLFRFHVSTENWSKEDQKKCADLQRERELWNIERVRKEGTEKKGEQ
jgi:hypothetical protein